MQSTFFLCLTPCSIVRVSKCFRGMYCFDHLGQRLSQASYKKSTLLVLGLFFDPRNRDCTQNAGKFLPDYVAITSLKRILLTLTPVRTSNPTTSNHMCTESVLPVHQTPTHSVIYNQDWALNEMFYKMKSTHMHNQMKV
jgi:hypothetical protein